MNNCYIALIHYPILNKHGEIVTTSVTNFDLHDLSRTAKTFGIENVFIVTPSETQRKMVDYIWDYWHDGYGATYNPDRKEAFGILEPKTDLEECCLTIEKASGKRPYLIATTAKMAPDAVGFDKLKQRLSQDDQPVLITFGTGHGLTEGFLESCDAILEPIQGQGEYNHLPVRSAVAIILDRLLGRE